MIGQALEECQVEVSGNAGNTATKVMQAHYRPPFFLDVECSGVRCIRDAVGTQVTRKDTVVILNLLADGKV